LTLEQMPIARACAHLWATWQTATACARHREILASLSSATLRAEDRPAARLELQRLRGVMAEPLERKAARLLQRKEQREAVERKAARLQQRKEQREAVERRKAARRSRVAARFPRPALWQHDPARLRECMARHQIGIAPAAALLGVAHRTVQAWLTEPGLPSARPMPFAGWVALTVLVDAGRHRPRRDERPKRACGTRKPSAAP
jgi:hypothetical protein